MAFHTRHVTIDDDALCFGCRKPIKTSAFYRYPNGKVAHLYCCKSPVWEEAFT